jgi:hypothetical protein
MLDLHPSRSTPGSGAWHEAVRPRKAQAPANPFRRRFDRVTLGLWLGGVVLGTAGCIVGACMPYRHPVAVTLSVLWWGIYLGCFGACIGALLGLLTKRNPASSSEASDGAGESPCVSGTFRIPAGNSDPPRCPDA